MRAHTFYWLVLVVGLGFIPMTSLFSQTKKEKLQQEQKKLKEELEELKAMIAEKENKKTMSMSQLNTLTKKIEKRQMLINNINDQMLDLDEEITDKMHDIELYRKDLGLLKEQYAKIISATYKKRATTNELMFIFSAQNFYQAFARMKYIRNYSNFRNKQAEKISGSINIIREKIDLLNNVKQKKTILLEDNKKENENLMVEKMEKDVVVKKLKSDINKLQSEHRQKVQAERQLANQIQKIIQEEIRKKREKRERERELERQKELSEQKKKPTNGGASAPTAKKIELDESMNTPEEEALQKDFISNKGKLPWPVSKGYVVEHFGRQSHALDPDLIIEKNGIGIKTNNGADVRAVFKGRVLNIFSIPGMQQSVMVEHGNYITVYSHLSLVYVRVGETINTKEVIGKVYTDESSGDAVTELQIWNGNVKMNPEDWIGAK